MHTLRKRKLERFNIAEKVWNETLCTQAVSKATGWSLRSIDSHISEMRRAGYEMKYRPNAFDEMYDRVTKTESGCWLWTNDAVHGYGAIRIGRRTFRAHKVSWERNFGPVPDGMYVCHKCDVPACINPQHLFLGTPLDNTRDRMAKKRCNTPRGSRSGSAVLNEDDVREIKRLVASGRTRNSLAREYGVAPCSIYGIFNGKLWSHVQ